MDVFLIINVRGYIRRNIKFHSTFLLVVVVVVLLSAYNIRVPRLETYVGEIR